jgi:hypothetical protein
VACRVDEPAPDCHRGLFGPERGRARGAAPARVEGDRRPAGGAGDDPAHRQYLADIAPCDMWVLGFPRSADEKEAETDAGLG